ncbi:MAG: dihydrofolate reductase family protein [bacterium]|nr:dihydrofolate reductase family protein [bacterium]
MASKRSKIKFTAFAAVSIDGRIAQHAKSGTDWTSREDWRFFQAALGRMDAVIAGRNTYEVAKDKLGKRNTIVLTSKVRDIRISGSVVFLNPKSYDLKKFLQSKKYKKVGIVGGAKVYDYCLRNKLLDELYLTVEPYVFTKGVPLFSGREFTKHRFKLASVKKLNKQGTILLQYKNAD